MGHIINKIRRQQRTALLNRDAMEREQRRQQGYPTAFPMLDGQGGIAWSEVDMAERQQRMIDHQYANMVLSNTAKSI